ncbi:zinc finger protein OZF-like isoform X1 [Phyllopteryx taeniolatus]|uniref:zinc finger protein OZF-like isoform X1 n=1 Tax=Phyllopteryx taeniolatus TaxID=161469 RepID=UPI002AD3CE9B|nr:zinc finger protein OZF-like isoform X1 [Phyllopteryx taeniolatus]
MLKNLVRERLIAAADEIFELFEKTIASYEEQVCRARAETEQRRQLEAVCDTQIVLRVQDVQQPICRPEELPRQSQWGCSSVKQEDPQHLNVKEEEEEADVSKFPLNRVSVKSEDEPPEWSQLHHESPSGDHCGGPPPDNLFAPLSDSDDMEEPLRSDKNCEGEDKHLKCSEKETSLDKDASQRGSERVTCSVCGDNFSKQHLIVHMRIHTGEKPFSCSVCAKDFIKKSQIDRHMRIHTGEKPFSCSVCNKPFIEKSHMDRHMRIHTGEKPFSCTTCGTTFHRKQHLEIHTRKHIGKKLFCCSVCGTAFSRKQHLEIHKRKHTGKNVFCCSVCGKELINKSNMVRHMRIHTGEKPFSCSVCSKPFIEKGNMMKHMRVHTGEKPFICTTCCKTFSRKQHLEMHEDTHRRKTL